MTENWQLSQDYAKQYTVICMQAATDSYYFENFRRDPVISTIIENSNKAWLEEAFLHLIRNEYWLLRYFEKFVTSEQYGNPVVYPLMDLWKMSPTTMRYVITLAYIKNLLGDLSGKNIIEIGGGYGGQCKVIHDLWTPASYTILDLPPVQGLQETFLSKFDIKPAFKLPDFFDFSNSVLIAWCSWSELDLPTRQWYFDQIISKCPKFIICGNYNYSEDLSILQKTSGVHEYANELCNGVIYKNE